MRVTRKTQENQRMVYWGLRWLAIKSYGLIIKEKTAPSYEGVPLSLLLSPAINLCCFCPEKLENAKCSLESLRFLLGAGPIDTHCLIQPQIPVSQKESRWPTQNCIIYTSNWGLVSHSCQWGSFILLWGAVYQSMSQAKGQHYKQAFLRTAAWACTSNSPSRDQVYWALGKAHHCARCLHTSSHVFLVISRKISFIFTLKLRELEA